MKRDAKAIIRLSGLNEGIHDFDFDLTNTFFENPAFSLFSKGEARVEIEMNKKTRMAELTIKMEGVVELTCDRCLDPYNQDFKYTGFVVLKPGRESEESDEDVIYIDEDAHELDMSHYLYESICLSLPFRHIHPNNDESDSCNEEMIKKLEQHLISDKKEDNSDPRWDKLKDLLQNNNN